MTPEVWHPVEPAARNLALALHCVTADAERRWIMQVHVKHIYEELTWLHGIADDVAVQHVGKIVARAAAIEDAGRPTPERERIPGLAEFMESGQQKIIDIMC
jgi:hypothetical protein